MFCDVCNTKEATVFLTQMLDGNVKKINLCTSCSKLQEVHDANGFDLAQLLAGLDATRDIEKVSISCPVCGFSQSDFKKRGRLGCSACYDAFAEGLSVMLRNMHRGMVHTGKVPVKIAHAYERASQLEILKNSLANAIAIEKYEDAAHYRDLLHQFEKEYLDNVESKNAKNTTIQDIFSLGHSVDLVALEEETPAKKSIDLPLSSKEGDLLL